MRRDVSVEKSRRGLPNTTIFVVCAPILQWFQENTSWKFVTGGVLPLALQRGLRRGGLTPALASCMPVFTEDVS